MHLKYCDSLLDCLSSVIVLPLPDWDCKTVAKNDTVTKNAMLGVSNLT